MGYFLFLRAAFENFGCKGFSLNKEEEFFALISDFNYVLSWFKLALNEGLRDGGSLVVVHGFEEFDLF